MTNDDEVCIPRLSSILLAVIVTCNFRENVVFLIKKIKVHSQFCTKDRLEINVPFQTAQAISKGTFISNQSLRRLHAIYFVLRLTNNLLNDYNSC